MLISQKITLNNIYKKIKSNRILKKKIIFNKFYNKKFIKKVRANKGKKIIMLINSFFFWSLYYYYNTNIMFLKFLVNYWLNFFFLIREHNYNYFFKKNNYNYFFKKKKLFTTNLIYYNFIYFHKLLTYQFNKFFIFKKIRNKNLKKKIYLINGYKIYDLVNFRQVQYKLKPNFRLRIKKKW